MLIWTLAGTMMGVYNIALNVALALWIQPQIFTFIACICLFQEFRYQHKWSQLKTVTGFVISCLFFGGLEVGLVFAFKV
jgi:ABC-type lipoprotein release transport system permease subunit